MRFVQPISNSLEVQYKLNQILHNSIQDDKLVGVAIVKQEGWVAVPMDSNSHITAMNEEHLQRVFLAKGYSNLSAVSLDPMGDNPSVLTFPTTVEGIEEFNREFGFFNFALFAGAPDWIIIRTVNDFDLVMGSADFVRQLLGCDLEEAFARFQTFATNFPASLQLIKEQLQLVHNHLQNDYPTAEIGSEFHLTNR